MFYVFRIYLYWTILWGLLYYISLSDKSWIIDLLALIDVIFILICAIYISMYLFRRSTKRQSAYINYAVLVGIALVPYALVVTQLSGGDPALGVQYLAALIRSLVMLMAGAVFVATAEPDPNDKKYQTVRRDIGILVAIQVVIAAVQKLYPELGAGLVVSLQDTQSAAAAAAEGNVAGAFANTVDLSYFLLAAFIALTQRNWVERAAPSFLMTSVFIYVIYATGSTITFVCLTIFIFALMLRCGVRRSYGIVVATLALLAAAGIIWNFELVYSNYNATVENLMFSRLGMVVDGIPDLFKVSPQGILFGFGTDFNWIVKLIINRPNSPDVFLEDGSVNVINDVFWAALMLGIGAPGAFLYVKVTASLFLKYVSNSSTDRTARNLAQLVCFLVLIAGFFNQILIIRTFTMTIIFGLLPLAMMSRRPTTVTQK
jgi:hypothetical protein